MIDSAKDFAPFDPTSQGVKPSFASISWPVDSPTAQIKALDSETEASCTASTDRGLGKTMQSYLEKSTECKLQVNDRKLKVSTGTVNIENLVDRGFKKSAGRSADLNRTILGFSIYLNWFMEGLALDRLNFRF